MLFLARLAGIPGASRRDPASPGQPACHVNAPQVLCEFVYNREIPLQAGWPACRPARAGAAHIITPLEGNTNRSPVPPYPSSFLIHHHAIPWHTLATYQGVPYRRLEGTSSQQYFSSCAFSPPTRQCLPGRSSCRRKFDSSDQCSNRAMDTQGQRRDIVSGQEICSGKWQVASAMNIKFSFLIELLLTVLPLLARPDSSSFVFVHFCSSPSRHGVRSVHSQWHFSGRGYRKEFARCLQRPRADILAAIFFVLRIQSTFTGPFQLQKTFINAMALCGTGVPEGVRTMSPKA